VGRAIYESVDDLANGASVAMGWNAQDDVGLPDLANALPGVTAEACDFSKRAINVRGSLLLGCTLYCKDRRHGGLLGRHRAIEHVLQGLLQNGTQPLAYCCIGRRECGL